MRRRQSESILSKKWECKCLLLSFWVLQVSLQPSSPRYPQGWCIRKVLWVLIIPFSTPLMFKTLVAMVFWCVFCIFWNYVVRWSSSLHCGHTSLQFPPVSFLACPLSQRNAMECSFPKAVRSALVLVLRGGASALSLVLILDWGWRSLAKVTAPECISERSPEHKAGWEILTLLVLGTNSG